MLLKIYNTIFTKYVTVKI